MSINILMHSTHILSHAVEGIEGTRWHSYYIICYGASVVILIIMLWSDWSSIILWLDWSSISGVLDSERQVACYYIIPNKGPARMFGCSVSWFVPLRSFNRRPIDRRQSAKCREISRGLANFTRNSRALFVSRLLRNSMSDIRLGAT